MKMGKGKEEATGGGEEAPIHGDILTAVFTHVPLVELVPACLVSKAWKDAVSCNLRHFTKIKPWLVVHTQCSRSPARATAVAYDPRSDLWLDLRQPRSGVHLDTPIRSSHSTLLYLLSPAKFAVSLDPLHLRWRHLDPPLVWRVDPIVAAVGSRIVVAGGACDFEADPLAVEIFDLDTGSRDACDSMPAKFRDSAAAEWLSIAVDARRMYVMEKCSGVAFSFDPAEKDWRGPVELRPDPAAYFSAIAFRGNSILLLALLGEPDNVLSATLWEVDPDSFEKREMGEMPEALLRKLKGEDSSLPSVEMSCCGEVVYVHNPSSLGELAVCEVAEGACRWRSLRNAAATDQLLTARMVFTCSDVGLHDLRSALASSDCVFAARE